MTTTENTAAVALCRAVRRHFHTFRADTPLAIADALTALERAINAAELGMGQETPAPFSQETAPAQTAAVAAQGGAQ